MRGTGGSWRNFEIVAIGRAETGEEISNLRFEMDLAASQALVALVGLGKSWEREAG